MSTVFVEISFLDHPMWRYVEPEGLAPEYLRFTAPKSWPDRPYNIGWNYCDDFVCCLFFAWNELPRSIIHPWSPLQEMQLLIRLDGLVTAFELYLPATPDAFEKWILRYQNAMEQGRAFARNLMASTERERAKGAGHWRPYRFWVKRYQYIVNLRNQVIRNRIRVNLGINRVNSF
ncbi:hypothetical protein ACHAQA_004309 [Verticillium albo-atrum]